MKKELQFLRQSLFVRRQWRNHNRRPIEGASVEVTTLKRR
jgi:hypothetical protein